MKRYQYLIIDDDDMDRLATNYYLKNYPYIEHKASFSSSKDGLNYLLNNKIDILFLDIDMPGMNGLELLKKIGDKVMCVIFITSHSEFAIEGFDMQAFDYIIKPLEQKRFDACMGRLKEYLDLKLKAELFEHSFKSQSILIKEGCNYVSIQPYEIIYLEALKDYTKIISLNKKLTTIHGNLGTTLKNENFKHFIRIHKSYAIQKTYIQTVKANEVVLVNDITLPLGQNYKKDLIEALS